MTGEDHPSLNLGLPGLVRRAAFLHREFMAIDAENRFVAGGGTVTYVLDSDVLKAFADPHLYGPEKLPTWQEGTLERTQENTQDKAKEKSQKVRGQGQLLPRRSLALGSVTAGLRDKEDQRAMNVVRQLTQEILERAANQPSEKLFQFPAHYKETESDIKFAAETARNEVGQSRAASQPVMVEANLTRTSVLVLRAMIEQGHDRIDIRRAVMSIAENQMRRSTFGQSRAVRQNDRFSILESQYAPRKELDALSDISVEGKFDDPIYEQGNRLLVDFLSGSLTEFRLNSTETSIYGDAQALASLAIMNKQVIDLDRNQRIVMISGSEGVVRRLYDLGPQFRLHLRQLAWQKKLPDGSSLDTWLSFFGYTLGADDKSGHANWLSDFSFRYFRHYTGFAKVFLIDEQDQPKVDDLFNGLFAMTTNQVVSRRAMVESIASSGRLPQLNVPNGESVKLYLDVLEQWDRLTARSLEAAQARAANLPEQAVGVIGDRILEAGISAADIEAEIAEHVARQRDRSMLELSQMGARALLAQKALSVRNPPDLFFSSLSNTNRIFENLARHDVYSREPDRFVQDYKLIDEETLGPEDNEGDDRQRSYLKFVVLGAIFSSAEKWSTALGHALRAVNVATRYTRKAPAVKASEGSEDVPNISGREAYYLAAVCFRMIAKSSEDLKVAREYLSKAVEKREEDIRLRSSLAIRLGPQRQISEALAMSLSEYYFTRFKNPDVNPDIRTLLKSAEALIKAWETQRFDGPMTLLTKVSVATNLIQVATILAYRRKWNLSDEELSQDVICQCFEFLIRPEIDQNSVVTALVRCYRASGAALLKRWDEVGIFSEEDISKLLDEAKRKVVMEYDPWRYENLYLFLAGRFTATQD